MFWHGSDLALLEVELVTYEVENLCCVGSSSDFSLFTSQPSSRQGATKVCVCWRQVWWDVSLTNQSSRYWWILIPLCKAISLTSLATTVNSMGAVDRPKGRALNWQDWPWMWKRMYFLDWLWFGIWKYVSLKSMEVTHSPVCREVLIVSGVSILNDSVFRKVFKGVRSRICLHRLLGLGTKNSRL